MDEVVCAIPDTKRAAGEGDALIWEASKYCKVWLGPEDDVLARYHGCAVEAQADIIMRITGDCPLISPKLCGAVLDKMLTDSIFDYVSNIEPRTFPRGLDCEVFTMKLLEKAFNSNTGYDREHVTTWMRVRPEVTRGNISSPWPIEGRLCIDTEDDYKVIKAYFDEAH